MHPCGRIRDNRGGNLLSNITDSCYKYSSLANESNEDESLCNFYGKSRRCATSLCCSFNNNNHVWEPYDEFHHNPRFESLYHHDSYLNIISLHVPFSRKDKDIYKSFKT